MKNKKPISILCLLCFSLVLLLPCITLLIMSVKDYRPISGLLGSSTVGLTNITALLQQTGLLRILQNTLTINIFAMVIGAVYLFVASLAVSVFQNPLAKALATLIFALPAVLPPNTYIIMLQAYLPTEFMTKSSVLLQLIASLEDGLRYSAVFVIAALFSKEDGISQTKRNVLLFIGIKLLRILATDTGFLNAFYNPLTYEHLDTYSSYLYRKGLMQSDFSGYAAGYVVQLLMQLLPACLGMFILISLCRSGHSRKKTAALSGHPDHSGQNELSPHFNSGNRGYFPCVILAAVPIALACLVWQACSTGSLQLTAPLVSQAYANGFLMAGASAAIIVCFGILLAAASIQLRSIGTGIVAILFFLCDTLLGPYMIGRQLGALDTLTGVLIQNIHYILPVSLITARILLEKRSKNLLPALTVSALGLAFAWFWGDHMAPLLTLRSAHKYPLSLMMHQVINRQGAIDFSAEDPQLAATLYILIPIIITGVCFVAGSVLNNREQKLEKIC